MGRRCAVTPSAATTSAFTTTDRVRSQLSLTWGIETFKTGEVEHTDEMVRQVDVDGGGPRRRTIARSEVVE